MGSILSFLKFVFKYKNGVVDQIMLYVSMICAFAVIFNVGYVRDPELADLLDHIIRVMFYALFIMTGLRTA